MEGLPSAARALTVLSVRRPHPGCGPAKAASASRRTGATALTRRLGALLLIASLAACGRDEVEPAELSAALRGDTLLLSHPVSMLTGGEPLRHDLSLPGLTFPTDVADLPGPTFAVLDRLDASISVFDAEGGLRAKFGRAGEGPGEYEEPYALLGVGASLVVWDKSGRVTVLDEGGGVVNTFALGDSDTRAIWQRVPLSGWEEPLQLSREDPTRRLNALGEGRFGLAVQRDERSLPGVQRGDTLRLPMAVLVFDSAGATGDTLLHQRGVFRRAHSPGSESRYSLWWESPFASRPVWTSGEGWAAYGHGRDTTVSVEFTETGDALTVAWPLGVTEVTDVDVASYRYWSSEGYRRSHGDAEADQVLEWPIDALRENDFVVAERPQLFGLLGSGRCLAVTGMSPEDSPLGEARSVLLIDVEARTLMGVYRLPDDAHLLRALQDGAFWAFTVEPDGTRTLRRYPLPDGHCPGA